MPTTASKSSDGLSRRVFLGRACGLTAGLASVSGLAASEEDRLAGECRRRMLLIYEALCRWKRAHGAARWPEGLSVLRQEGFLTDLRVWVCPLVEKTGNLKFAPSNSNIISDSPYNPESNYGYEFNSGYVNDDEIDAPKDWEKREWKAALARTSMGGVVPVLRCMAHTAQAQGGNVHERFVHNVGMDGRFYLSGEYWEYEFSDRRPEPYTMPFMVRHHPGPAGQTEMPRPAGQSSDCVDLSPIANANPDLPWLDGKPQGPTLGLFLDETRFGSRMTPTPFDARVLVQTTGAVLGPRTLDKFLRGLGFVGQAYPRQSGQLPLGGRRAKRIEVLHGTAFKGKYDDVAGEVVVGVRGSDPIRVQLRYGRNTSWWRLGPTRQVAPGSHTVGQEGDVATVYRLAIDVPPTAAAAGLEWFQLVSDPQSTASPFVLGLTLN